MTKKAIFIDSYNCTVSLIEIKDSLAEWYRLLKCDNAEIGFYINNDMLIVDEDGKYRMHTAGFILKTESFESVLLRGNGLICGYNKAGDTVDVKSTLDEILPLVIWKTLLPLPGATLPLKD